MEAIGSGDGAQVTEMIEVNEVDRESGVREGVGGGERVRNAGQQRKWAWYHLEGCWANSRSELDITQEGC